MTQDISDLELKLIDAKALLVKLTAAAAEAQKEAEEKASTEAQLADLDKQGDELAKKKAALMLKLGKKK